MEDGLDELTTRYIFFTAAVNRLFHPHLFVVSAALSAIVLLFCQVPFFTPTSKAAMKRAKTAEGDAAAADASLMKKVDGDWVKSSVKKADLQSLCTQGLLPPAN